MGFPDTDLPNQWTDGEFLGQAKLNPRIDGNLNLLAQRLRALGGSQLAAHQTVANTAWINAGAFVLATGMTADLDPAGTFASNVWTVPSGGTGVYDISAQGCMNIGGTSRTRTGIGISINGSLTPLVNAMYAVVTTGSAGSNASIPPVGVSLTAGQTVGLLLFHDATTAIGSIVSGGSYSYLRITRVS